MTILFLTISLLLTAITVYSIGRMFNSHNKLVEVFKKYESVRKIIIVNSIMFATIIFILLIILNNNFWHF